MLTRLGSLNLNDGTFTKNPQESPNRQAYGLLGPEDAVKSIQTTAPSKKPDISMDKDTLIVQVRVPTE